MGKHFDKLPAKSITSLIEAQIYESPPHPRHWLVGRQHSGHGSIFTSYPNLRQPKGFSFYDSRHENLTIDALLSDDDFLQTQKYAQKYIDHNLELLLEEVPLPPNEVLRIPALFKNFTYPWPSNLDGLPPRLHRAAPGQSQVIAFLLVAINGVVIGSDGLTAKPWGLIVDDHDTLEQAMRDVYGQAGIKVHFVGDFMSHHVNGGGFHCGTNTLRDTRVEWWS
ncbi:Protein-arginine deiminase, C-terminal [Fusarium oxysporum f. sp. vasinfectum]|nr:Protein-arginine deiminase, C-terminal [Fusarium oxysporum f. sp. vasinfectum]